MCHICEPKANAFNEGAGRKVILPGVHSLVNGGPLLTASTTADDAARFAQGLNRMFVGVGSFDEWSRAMLIDRMRRLGFERERTVPLEEYLAECLRAGIDESDGWKRLTRHLVGEPDGRALPDAAAQLGGFQGPSDAT